MVFPEQKFSIADISGISLPIATKFWMVRGLASGHFLPVFGANFILRSAMPCGNMHQFITDALFCFGFIANFTLYSICDYKALNVLSTKNIICQEACFHVLSNQTFKQGSHWTLKVLEFCEFKAVNEFGKWKWCLNSSGMCFIGFWKFLFISRRLMIWTFEIYLLITLASRFTKFNFVRASTGEAYNVLPDPGIIKSRNIVLISLKFVNSSHRRVGSLF